jgi:hypothetical protein
MRQAEVSRNTLETRITVRLDLDGSGQAKLATGVPFDRKTHFGRFAVKIEADPGGAAVSRAHDARHLAFDQPLGLTDKQPKIVVGPIVRRANHDEPLPCFDARDVLDLHVAGQIAEHVVVENRVGKDGELFAVC